MQLTFCRRQPRRIAGRLADAGLAMYAQLVRASDADTESTPQAYLIARKLTAGPDTVAPW